MSETGLRGRRCRSAGLALALALVPGLAAAEPAGPLTSREEDNRTERTQESLTAQGSWAGTVRSPASEPETAPQTRVASGPKPVRKRVRTRSSQSRTQIAQRPLNFAEIRRALFSGY